MSGISNYVTFTQELTNITPTTWITLAALLLIGILLLAVRKSRKAFTPKMLAHGAICLALSFVLSCLKVSPVYQGGSITPASMMPLILFAWLYGAGPGMLAGMAYGLLQLLQGPWIVHPVQVLLDYPLAFAMLGLAGLFKGIDGPRGLLLGLALATLGRYVCAVLSGVLFFASYAQEAGQNVWVYSTVYNITYMGPDAILCALVCLIPGFSRAVRRIKES